MTDRVGFDVRAGGGQTYVERPPVPELVGLVRSVWIQRVAADAGTYTHRHIPNGSAELVCRVGAPPQFVGPLTRPVREELRPGTTVIGLRLRPGAGPALFGAPASELVDLTMDLEDLWGRPAVELAELMDAAASPEEALVELQRHVVGRLAETDVPDTLVTEVVRRLMPWQLNAVGSLTSSLHISEAQLRRRCRAAVGLSPKVLHRMLRFQGFLAVVQHRIAEGRAHTDEGLAVLAAESGYADQPHLNRECMRLTGLSPRAFLDETQQACSCGHDHAASFKPVLRGRPLRRSGLTVV